MTLKVQRRRPVALSGASPFFSRVLGLWRGGMRNNTQTGILLLMLCAGLVGCGDSVTPSAPSPQPAPKSQAPATNGDPANRSGH